MEKGARNINGTKNNLGYFKEKIIFKRGV